MLLHWLESGVMKRNEKTQSNKSKDSLYDLMAGLEIDLEDEDELLIHESSNDSSSFNFLIPSRYSKSTKSKNVSYYPKLRLPESDTESILFSSFTNSKINQSKSNFITKNTLRKLFCYIGIILFISIPMFSYN